MHCPPFYLSFFPGRGGFKCLETEVNVDWQWILVTVAVFGLCTIIPVHIYAAGERKRTLVNWLVLIPLSLIIIFYIYPAGIEFFKNLAVR